MNRAEQLPISFSVNEESVDLAVPCDETLLTTLRTRLALTGAKRGCNQGVCGACSVLIDGKVMRSCLALTANCDGRRVTTVEGLSVEGEMSVVQCAMVDAGAIQCGFCTPGFVVALTALFQRDARPSDEEILEAVGGNLCRCTGYMKIIAAARHIAAAGEA
jgi:aerobic carbon-monoxide dehydrogenase small subunit